MANEHKTIMISSTARDLPEHRKEVMDACLRQGMFPDMMEHLPASDADAIRVSVEMVDRADIYLGIFAYRYGYVPKGGNPKQISVTEMEYNRAVERNIPRLIFIMHEDHQLRAADVETGEGAEKLKKFKDRIGTDRVAGFFKSPTDLRSQIIQALVPYRESDITQFHYVSDIPNPPEAYIAHPYTLLQTHRLIGRQKELNLLTNWVTKKQDEIYWTRVLSIVAIGGMGKSALAWKWFNDIAPQKMQPLAGRLWWSFYESDATFENFIIRALAYTSKCSREDIEKSTKSSEREEQLLQILDREPYLFVLDGLERILTAYARMDAARLSDDDIDQRTANFVTKAYGLPKTAAQSFVGQHLLRKTTDPRAGLFFRKLANVRSARALISTRLYPADLQSVTGEPIRGCSVILLPGLADDDALNLWRALNISGSRKTLLTLFQKFENHPLLVQSLAGEVANYRRAPGDFERWQKDHPKFDPFNLSIVNARAHVLQYALSGLNDKTRKVLHTLAAFRMPVPYDTLVALLVGKNKLFTNESKLTAVLAELEDRGLLGWDKHANRYDLHPIVRGVVWSGLSASTRRGVYSNLHMHFDSLPMADSWLVSKTEELTPVIELFGTLVGLRLYNKAYGLIYDHLRPGLYYRLGEYRIYSQILESLVRAPNADISGMLHPHKKAFILNALANSLSLSGHPMKAILFLERSIELESARGINYPVHIGNLAIRCLFPVGRIFEAQRWINYRVLFCQKSYSLHAHSSKREDQKIASFHRHNEAIGHSDLGYILAILGQPQSALQEFEKALSIFSDSESMGIVHLLQGKMNLYLGETQNAIREAETALNLIKDEKLQRDIVRVQNLIGAAALELGQLKKADEYLHNALTSARAGNLIEEELPALVALAELKRRQRDLRAARILLDDLWEYAERGPYPLFHADALNVLAQIERDEGNTEKATEAAMNAYRSAWCDGPPFAYHWGLQKAKNHLKDLGVPEPEMPPFDESKFEPIPRVEVNPKDVIL